ncbi:PAS-domain containing protein [Kordiimonas pumila]|uniref:histidine kinase n=1 Tax=Kordiimonas pumila TaxID=2161677 RepID=A0ABV7CZX9_9PROT|nr:PAS-domain containing protein [Kordiimonas pumila]
MEFASGLTVTAMAVLFAVLLTWFGVSLYAFWRAGRMNDRAQSLQDLADFLDSMIKTDHRYPIWLWPDGRVQADAGAFSLLGVPEKITNLDDLASSTSGKGLPEETIQVIRDGLETGCYVPSPLVIDRGRNKARLIIDIQWLPSKEMRWPYAIMWLEEALENPGIKKRRGVRALELRLKDLTRAFNSLPYPVWVRGADNSLVEVNESYVEAVDGISAEDVLDKGLELFDRGKYASLQKARETGHSVRERRFGVIAGQRRAFAVTKTPLDAEGHVLSIAVDVTGEEEALSELSRVLESQSETLNRLRSPVAIFGPGQTLRFYNSAFARLSHVSEDILSSEISHSELLDAMRDKRRLPEQVNFLQWKVNILRQYTTLLEPFEEMWHLPDGSAHRVVTQPHPLGGLLILFEDVTDSLALERSYNTLIAVQQETLDSMREGIAVFGSNGLLQFSNPAFSEMWGLAEADLKGDMHLSSFVERVIEKQIVEHSQTGFLAELSSLVAERKHATGRIKQRLGPVLDCALVPMPDGGIMLTQTDITDTFKVEQALRERSSALEAADRLKSEFIMSMSYELRTPLNSIMGFAEMLDQRIFGDMTDQQQSYIKNILSAADQLKKLISDVLDLAVIEAGEVSLDFIEVDVRDAMKEAADLVQELARKVNIALTLDCPDTVGHIMADELRLKQTFYNMVSSMLNFARYGGEVFVKLSSTNDSVSVSVGNQFSGMVAVERDRLIETFEMGASPGGRRATGLDLSLARSIIKMHQGEIRLEPLDAEGLVLSCVLPRVQKV